MKVYEVVVKLLEGEDVSLGYYSTKERAHAVADENLEEWADGPNVDFIIVEAHKVED